MPYTSSWLEVRPWSTVHEQFVILQTQFSLWKPYLLLLLHIYNRYYNFRHLVGVNSQYRSFPSEYLTFRVMSHLVTGAWLRIGSWNLPVACLMWSTQVFRFHRTTDHYRTLPMSQRHQRHHQPSDWFHHAVRTHLFCPERAFIVFSLASR